MCAIHSSFPRSSDLQIRLPALFLSVNVFSGALCIKFQISATYMATYITSLLTSWCRILFEKLIVAQIVKNIPLSYGNLKVYYRVHTSTPRWDPILSQLNPVHLIDPHLPKVHLPSKGKVKVKLSLCFN